MMSLFYPIDWGLAIKMSNINLINKLKQLQPEIYKSKLKSDLVDELRSLQTRPHVNIGTHSSKDQQIEVEQERLIDTLKIYLLEIELQNRELKETCRKLQEELAKFKEVQGKYPVDRIDELLRKNKELQSEITECLRVREELNKLSRAIEQSPSTVMITDAKGNIEYVNPKFTQLTGYTLEEVIGKNPRILKPNNMPSEAYRKLLETITSGD